MVSDLGFYFLVSDLSAFMVPEPWFLILRALVSDLWFLILVSDLGFVSVGADLGERFSLGF